MKEREALKLALEALDGWRKDFPDHWGDIDEKAVDAIKEAFAQEKALQALHDENERLGLYKDAYEQTEREFVRLQCITCGTVYADGIPPQVAQPEQEPVAEVVDWGIEGPRLQGLTDDWPRVGTLLYTTPPQRTWEGLSVFEINDLVENTEYEDYRDLVERTEAKLKEKNT